MGRVAKGSFTLREIEQIIKELPNDTPLLDPISEKVERALSSAVPFDLFPFVIELVSLEGFISKKLALNFLTWVIIDKDNWRVDPDKVLSLRRIRVTRFIDLLQRTSPVIATDQMIDAAGIMDRIGRLSYFNLTKKDFNTAIAYISQKSEVAIFAALDSLTVLYRQNYDVSAALQSVIEWKRHTANEDKQKQLELL